MAKAKGNKGASRLNNATRKVFLAHLAETANVAASARAAGISGNAAYAERRRLPAFQSEWKEALGEGYARLESDLLAEALQPANANTSDATLKARAQKHRLRLSLLGLHGRSVNAPSSAGAAPAKIDLGVLKAQLILKLTQMRDRAGLSLDGTGETP